jgi:hypothetical protein
MADGKIVAQRANTHPDLHILMRACSYCKHGEFQRLNVHFSEFNTN